MKQQKFSFEKRLHSFKYAYNGLKLLLKHEHNARVHALVAVCVIICGIVLKISASEWIAVVFAIGSVFSMEIVNSAIEGIADIISPEWHAKIKMIKDLSAAGVLVSAIAALVIGLIIFVPKVM